MLEQVRLFGPSLEAPMVQNALTHLGKSFWVSKYGDVGSPSLCDEQYILTQILVVKNIACSCSRRASAFPPSLDFPMAQILLKHLILDHVQHSLSVTCRAGACIGHNVQHDVWANIGSMLFCFSEDPSISFAS